MTICSASYGYPFEDPHPCSPDSYYTLIDPNGMVRHFCQRDCLQLYYEFDFDHLEDWYWARRAELAQHQTHLDAPGRGC